MSETDSRHFVQHARYGRLHEVMDYVENKNIDINYVGNDDIWKSTALHWSSNNGHVLVVKYLLKKGARTDILDWNGETCLSSALNRAESDILSAYHEFDKKEFNNKLKENFVKLCKNGNLKAVKVCAGYLKKKEMSQLLESDPLNTFWNACKDGHLNVIKIALMLSQPRPYLVSLANKKSRRSYISFFFSFLFIFLLTSSKRP